MQGSLQKAETDRLSRSRLPLTPPTDSVNAGRAAAAMLKVRASPLRKSAYCEVNFDHDTATVWIHFEPSAPHYFTSALIEDLGHVHSAIKTEVEQDCAADRKPRLRYQVLASRIPEIFSLGGDLALFRQCITSGDTHSLRCYAQAAVSLVHSGADAFGGELTTIALVQGQALGGGFEAALAAHVLVAERSAKMAFPEGNYSPSSAYSWPESAS